MKSIVKYICCLLLISSCILIKLQKSANNVVDFFNDLFENDKDNNSSLDKLSLFNYSEVNRFIKNSNLKNNNFQFKQRGQLQPSPKSDQKHTDDLSASANAGDEVEELARRNSESNAFQAENQSQSQLRTESEEFSQRNSETPQQPEKAAESSTAASQAAKAASQPTSGDNSQYQGWLQIKSMNFRNADIFPEIVTKYDKDFFRINTVNPNKKTEFYFIMNDKFILYKSDEADQQAIQVLRVEKLNKINYDPMPFDNLQKNILYCVSLEEDYDLANTNLYKICSAVKEEFYKFFCKLAALKKLEFEGCSNNSPGKFNFEVQNAEIVVPIPSRTCNEHFNYKQNGRDWECLCKEGLSQSPIDLPKVAHSVSSPVTPIFLFEQSSLYSEQVNRVGLLTRKSFPEIKYENESIQVHAPSLGRIITLNDEAYTAEDIIFHTPSEHTIAGRRFDMEMQVIYKGKGKDNVAKQAVLSFLFVKKPGAINKFLEDIDFYSLPNMKNKRKILANKLFIPKVFSSVHDKDDNYSMTEEDYLKALNKPFSFYTYEGSLTQPPCSEDTLYHVVSEPLPIGAVTLQLAQEALKNPDLLADLYTADSDMTEASTAYETQTSQNFRATQSLNGRKVHHYNHDRYNANISNFLVKPSKSEGHFEKIKKVVQEIKYIEGSKPSGFPGAVYLDEKELPNNLSFGLKY